MRLTDAERVDLLTRMLEDAIILIRDLASEIGQHRAVDGRITDTIEDIETILGKEQDE